MRTLSYMQAVAEALAQAGQASRLLPFGHGGQSGRTLLSRAEDDLPDVRQIDAGGEPRFRASLDPLGDRAHLAVQTREQHNDLRRLGVVQTSQDNGIVANDRHVLIVSESAFE